jgi:hypothetical protein
MPVKFFVFTVNLRPILFDLGTGQIFIQNAFRIAMPMSAAGAGEHFSASPFKTGFCSKQAKK